MFFTQRSKVIDAPKESTFLDEDEDPLGVWEYEDRDPSVKMLLNTIGREEERPTKHIQVRNLDRLKKISVRLGLPHTVRGAIDRQKALRMRVREHIVSSPKQRLDAHHAR